MKGFKMMFSETKRFYFVMIPLAILLYVVPDCAYMCYNQNIVSFEPEQIAQIEEALKTQDAMEVFQRNCVSLVSEIGNKAEMFELFSLDAGICFIALLLLIRYFAFSDSRAREFRCTWPVKNWVRELYDYLAMGISILAVFVLQIVLLIVAQTMYNHRLMDIIGADNQQPAMENLVSVANQDLTIVMVCFYIVPLVSAYTWLYLGMSLAKNPVLGTGIALVTRVGLAILSDTIIYDIGELVVNRMHPANPEKLIESASNLGELVFCTFYDSEIIYYYNDWLKAKNGVQDVAGGAEIVNVWFCVKGIMLLVLILAIIIAGRKKELSKGKLLYFPILDYPLSVMTGAFCFGILNENNQGGKNNIIAITAGIVVAVVIYLVIHPVSVNRSKRLEVK